jgi:di/tricarboxylate transporter
VSADAWFTLGALAVMMSVMAFDRFSPVVVMAAAVIGLMAMGVLDEKQAFAGFSDSAPITIAALYILAAAVESTGALGWFTRRALAERGAGSDRFALARLLVPTAGLSAFVANTPLVSILVPRVMAWCRRTGKPPAQYLMPLSYAAVLGGVVTVMGTSTNLVISSLLENAGREPLGLFEVTPVGVAVALVGVVIVVIAAPRVLPDRSSPADLDRSSTRDFTVELRVIDSGPLVGRTIEESGLRHLDAVYLASVERVDNDLIEASPSTRLEGGDRLVFVGDISRLLDLQRVDGLVLAEERHSVALSSTATRRVFEAVVAPSSALVDSTLRELDFRERYGAVVVAVHRSGERLVCKPGDVRFRGGDVLVMLAPPGFEVRQRATGDFLLITGSDNGVPRRRDRARLVEAITLAVVVAAAGGWLSLQAAAVYAALGLLATRTLSVGEARRAVRLDIVVMMAFSVALGIATDQSGLAREIGTGLVERASGLGDLGLVLAILLATMAATELLSNNAAAALMVPLALSVAEASAIDERALVMAVLIGASCSFITPIGYQTNTMVFGLGGYRFSDFARLGLPVTLSVIAVTMFAIPVFIGL